MFSIAQPIITTSQLDFALIAVSWSSTCAFLLLALLFCRRRAFALNALLAGTVFCAFGALSLYLATPPWRVPLLLWSRIFDGTYKRLCLLLFWSLCLVSSLLFSAIVSLNHRRLPGTSHRKFFHLTASLVTVSGLFHDPSLLCLSAHLLLQIFIILEILRSFRVWPWADWLDDWLLVFLDEQDSPALILTPLYLLAGINLPILLDFRLLTSAKVSQFHFAGVLSVGIGDSFAALVGSRYGRIRWPLQRRKTMEGSLAMFFGQILIAEALFGLCSLNLALVLSSLAATLAEAYLHCCDNLVIPLCSMLLFWLFE